VDRSRSLICYCQHSVGVGHLVRTMALVEELKHWYKVTLVSGGHFPDSFKIPDAITFVQLPALRLNAEEQLEAVQTDMPLHKVMLERKRKMLEVFKSVRPDIFLTDYFPFGKKEFVGELLPVLKLARQSEKPVFVACSLRDILEPKSNLKKQALDLGVPVSNSFYDAVLVHADPKVIRLEKSYALYKQLKLPIHYTGYVTRQMSATYHIQNASKKVVLSIGGGKVGEDLLHLILKVFRGHPELRKLELTIITGPNFPENARNRLIKEHDLNGLVVKKQVPDLTEEWADALFSISMGGYNTTMELLSFGIPALVIPFHNERNSEQLIRSKRLHDLGMLRMLDMSEVSIKQVEKAVVGMLSFIPKRRDLDLNGVVQSVELLEDLYWEKCFNHKKIENQR